VPVLAVGGAISTTGPLMQEMLQEVAENVAAVRVPRSGHWVAEENPKAVASALLEFLRTAPTPQGMVRPLRTSPACSMSTATAVAAGQDDHDLTTKEAMPGAVLAAHGH